MTATATQEPEAPEVARITQVEDLPDPVRADIIARREAGETLAELKSRFAHVDSAVIQQVLPPANARERKQREAKTEVTKGVGGRSGQAKSEPKVEAPKPEPKPRYAEGKEVGDLADRTLAYRQVVGRNRLAELLGEDVTGSAVWRWENGRIHPDEVDGLKAGLTKVEERITSGEFVKEAKAPAAKSPSKAALEARVADALTLLREAAADKKVTKAGAIQSAIERLDPPQPTA